MNKDHKTGVSLAPHKTRVNKTNQT